MRTVTIAERRARLGVRHRLAVPLPGAPGDPMPTAAATRSMVALHATDPATVFLSVMARCPAVDVAGIEAALYAERSVVRMLGMRRTMFVVPADLAPVIHACGGSVTATQRRRYLQLIREGGLGDAAWVSALEEDVVTALAARGAASASQLSTDVPRLRSKLRMAEGKPYEAQQTITSWVMMLLGADGRVMRGRPNGSWTSSQWSWSSTENWLGAALPELAPEAGRIELVRRWLAAFGPGTLADLRWWTGWTLAQLRPALAAIRPVEVDLGGPAPGLLLPQDAGPGAGPIAEPDTGPVGGPIAEPISEPIAEPDPWVALLPALDPTSMGWAERSWYLGEHQAAIFDRNGNAGPTIWADGRIIGGWGQGPGGDLRFRLLEDVGTQTRDAVAAAAARTAAWLGGVRVIPRFRTPLERELSG